MPRRGIYISTSGMLCMVSAALQNDIHQHNQNGDHIAFLGNPYCDDTENCVGQVMPLILSKYAPL